MANQVEFRQVSKRYNLRLRKGWRIRYAVHDWLEARRIGESAHRAQDFWAVKGVTLPIAHGDSLGLIGDNGAGKSTLLKLIAGVTFPTQGQVLVRGRVGALVDIGAGMHPDLTGSENIYLYGTILGLSRREIRRRFDDIVGFAEFSTFLDVPLKRYSSGMKIRLGFAVAAFLDPDILLIDEVLAVGDVAFQRKCIDRIRTLQDGGTTIVFVSHDLPSVERICRQVVWIKEGQIHEIGSSAKVINHYLSFVEQRFVDSARLAVRGNGSIEVERVVLTDGEGAPRVEFSPREDVVVHVSFLSGGQTDRAEVEFHIKIVDPVGRTLILTSSGARALPFSGSHVTIQCRVRGVPLAQGTYQIWGQVVSLPDRREEIPWQPIAAFAIASPDTPVPRSMLTLHHEERPILDVPTQWSEDGQFVPQDKPAAQRFK